jgi:hypothetical protein
MIIQNAANGWSQWFYTNAPAAWISAVVATVGFVLVLRSRKKPKRVVVREVEKSSLVRIWPSVRDKIHMTFNGHPVQNLGQIDLEILNEGSEVISHPGFEVSLADGSTILDVLLTPIDPHATAQVNANRVVIVLPYLNPYAEHKQVVKLSILVDGDTEHVAVSGDGVGWSTRRVPLPTRAQRSRKATQMIVMLSGLAIYAAGCLLLANQIFRFGRGLKYWVSLPMVLGLGYAFRWIIRNARLRSKV